MNNVIIVVRWIGVLSFLCVALSIYGIGKAFEWLGDKAETLAEVVTGWAGAVVP